MSNATVMYNGVECPVISKSGAWTTISIDGKEKKVRVPTTKARSAGKTPTKNARKAPAKRAATRKPKDSDKLIDADLSKYVVSDIKTPSGRKAIDTGDDVAKKLRGRPLDEVYKLVSEKTGITQKDLHAKYDKLNPGMQRMNLGNRLRGALNAE